MMTSRSKPAVSLVVAVYQRDDFLEKVFLSLLNQTLGDFEIVIGDDGSGPAIAEIIHCYANQFAYPIQHVWHEDNGFRKTIIVNKAVTRTRADYLVFIDGDCILHHRFLERHYRRRRKRQALSGRRVMFDHALTARVTEDDVRSKRVEHIPYWWKHSGKIDCWNGFYLPFLYGIRNRRRTDYPMLGCNFSVHKEDFYRVNGYDERIIGRCCEDDNLWARFINSGIAVRTVSREALQYHLYHTSGATPHSKAFIERFRSCNETRTPCGIVKD